MFINIKIYIYICVYKYLHININIYICIHISLKNLLTCPNPYICTYMCIFFYLSKEIESLFLLQDNFFIHTNYSTVTLVAHTFSSWAVTG